MSGRTRVLVVVATLALTACGAGDSVVTDAEPGTIVRLRTVPVDGSRLAFTSYRNDVGLCLDMEFEDGLRSMCGSSDGAADVPLSSETVTRAGETDLYVAYGLVIDAAEVSVDIEFSAGNVVRVDIDSNGFYLWMAPNRPGSIFEIVELRFVGADGSLLRTEDRRHEEDIEVPEASN